MLLQIQPSPILSGLIKHYLYFQTNGKATGNYRLFTDGNPGMVFHFGSPFIQSTSLHQPAILQPANFLYGQIQQYYDMSATGQLRMLAVVLRPYALYRLFAIPAFEWNNLVMPLENLFGRDIQFISEQMAGCTVVTDMIRILETFFLRKSVDLRNTDQFFLEAMDSVYRSQGMVEINQLARKVHISERQLERKFKQFVGLSPKKFCEIVRFHHLLRQLRPDIPQKISSAAYDCGYYDSSHLNSHFRKITGITPLQYRQGKSLLAVNFLRVQVL